MTDEKLLIHHPNDGYRELKWQKEPPTEPGWYWLRLKDNKQIVKVNGGIVTMNNTTRELIFDELPIGIEWLGPIPAPEPSQEED